MGLRRSRWRRVVKACVPGVVRRRLRYWRALPRRSARPTTSAPRSRRLQPGAELEVYWLATPNASGPAASLYVEGDEIMRIDCLEDEPHMHLNVKQSRLLRGAEAARLCFPPGPLEDHLDRAAFELVHNARYALRTNRNRRVRRSQLPQETLAAAAAWMREAMQELVVEHRPAQPAGPVTGGERRGTRA